MEEVKQINIKRWTYSFYNDIIDLNDFEPKVLKIDKTYYKEDNIYYIGNITIKNIDECKTIYSVNPLHLRIDHASGCPEEKNGNKYFIFDDFADENKELLKKYAELWGEIKNEI